MTKLNQKLYFLKNTLFVISISIGTILQAHSQPLTNLPQDELKQIYNDLQKNISVANQHTSKLTYNAQRFKKNRNSLGQGGLFPYLQWNPENDTLDYMVDQMTTSNLSKMEQLGLLKGKPEKTPWSDSYWPIFLGSAAYRYNDPQFPSSSDWKINSDYLFQSIEEQKIKLHSSSPITTDFLSPSEKYDLYVGDNEFLLSRYQIEEGRTSYEKNLLQNWEGHCHGWSPASFMFDRPKSAVTLSGKLGHLITFYPSDIKALATTLWANAITHSKIYSRFSGVRCNKKIGDADFDQDPRCQDINPAMWHLIMTNQMGASKGNIIMDKTVDFQVWNQPIVSYTYTYFNPATGLMTKDLSSAQTGLFWNDPFSGRRAFGTTSVVGIIMDVQYLVETSPSTRLRDSTQQDAIQKVRYVYDLEQDLWGNLIGGLWYKLDHPDFIWNQAKSDRVTGPGDDLLTQGSSVTYSAQKSSALGMPLASVVEDLIRLANP